MRPAAALAATALTAGLTGVAASCADDGPVADPLVVAVVTQRCASPARSHGVATAIGDGLVVTAGHVVDGALRDLRVGGRPARVTAIDRRSDLALVAVDLDNSAADAARLAPSIPGAALLVTPDGTSSVAIDRHVTLVVDDAGAGTTLRRAVVAFAPPVAPGTSGSPLLDGAGRLVGVVISTADVDVDGVDDESYAVTAAEVQALVDRGDDGSSDRAAGGCSGR